MHRHTDSPSSGSLYLSAGLGNPGPKYAENRHNVGFQCIDEMARHHGIDLNRIKFKSRWGQGQIGRHKVILAKPITFMNSSGEAVGPLSRYFKVPPERILVIYDDLDLDFSRLRMRPAGSSGGHNGIKSIISHLSTQEFPRVRVGIGRPTYGDPVDYVLNDFDIDQAPVMGRVVETVDQMVQHWLDKGIRDAMNVYNGAAPLAEPAVSSK